MQSMLHLSRSIKRTILILADVLLLILATFLSSSFLEVLTNIPQKVFINSLFIGVIVYVSLAAYFKVFSVLTRYTSSTTLVTIGISLFGAHLAMLLYSLLFLDFFSLRFIFLSLTFAFILLVTPRIVWRSLSEKERYRNSNEKRVRTLVAGAGSGGRLFISTVNATDSDIEIVGIVDKDKNKWNTYIEGKKVWGDKHDIPRLVDEYAIDQVTIAIPSLNISDRETIIEICNECGVKVNSMPNVEDIVLGKIGVSSLRNIDIADLLERDEIVLEQDKLSDYFDGKTVLITGAGGSIGSEICRQIAHVSPKRILLLGHGENSIYLIHKELSGIYDKQIEIVPIIADIQDRELIFDVMTKYRPDVVYHAAAHKHVPLMEYNPKEAVKNNIFGTKNVAEASKVAGVAKFVMVSTDKAVNPPNVMGATKRVAEMIVTGLNEEGKTQFVAVRFGNVLGSRGSVVPVFKEQIEKGGPVTVTDFRMTRYFMTIPEASRLVIQAGYLATGGEIFVLDMGQPVLIRDLASKLIKLSGYTEEEIGIVESGIRPGEKLYEELLTTEERVANKVHEKIFIGRSQNCDPEILQAYLDQLGALTESELKESLVAFAKQE